jgi:hypothetical protein
MRTLIWISLFFPLVSFAQTKPLSIGIRTTAFYETHSIALHSVEYFGDSRPLHGLQYVGFGNYAFGKNKRWLSELNYGYNTYTVTGGEDYYFNNPGLPPSGFKNTVRVSAFGLDLRYAFAEVRQLNWKHYAGISLSTQRFSTGRQSIDALRHTYPGIVSKSKGWANYIGLQYLGNIAFSEKCSIQMLAGYAISAQYFDLQSDLTSPAQKSIHRVNISFGFGYHL